ncbi:hypothetical protein BDV28DRAFT_146138 [Aspergillus coremiiformis]|uniref:Glucose-methanol-choline oxidoreductase N-terminal domain-containing protein n=1 Tax=Aspergillus coremiiformis TaxID=138285 RepID=A0A5N6ZCU3_9EURO|nr:hypothetical protein BDV28DRAFT_146138 [Aspergillus coremiiformis]
MRFINRLLASLLSVSTVLPKCWAQSGVPVAYTDAETGITFDTWSVPAGSGTGGLVFGVALPSSALTTDATEFIGYLQCTAQNASSAGWCGISLGGSMNNNLLFLAYPYKDSILTSLRFSSGYSMPKLYSGRANVTQIASRTNSTHFTLLFRCENCLTWDQNGQTGNATTSKGRLVLGYAQSNESPQNPSCPDNISLGQHENQGIIAATLDKTAASASYTDWVKLAKTTVPGECSGGGGGGNGTSSTPVPNAATYDYIVVGSGAGGIPVADRLSEAGHRVLLIEKGPPSSGRWGGKLKPDWLASTNLTRFDVPGLCNQIWVDATGIACTDTDQMAGCVLGGGTAVNAGLWWRPNPADWDYNFPAGWKSSDMQAPADRVFARIPGTDHPSADGKIHLQQGANVLSKGLQAAGWKPVTLNDVPGQKTKTFGPAPFMFSHGERGGPLGTYLVSANGRDNFDRWMNTTVKRVIRQGGRITGVEVEATLEGGYAGTVNVTAGTGRVILSAGAFGSPKILFRSGIGPKDQLSVVKGSPDGKTMVAESDWIELPVGHNLVDHVNTDLVVTHSDVVFYDFKAAYKSPIQSDMTSYLNDRTGILAQAAPNIGPIIFDEITGPDGIKRQIQWTARVEGSRSVPDGHSMTISQYLGRGSTSRGQMGITSGLNTVVSTVPYLRDKNDVDAVIKGIQNLQGALNGTGLTWNYPALNTSAAEFVDSTPITTGTRRANHWMGTCKLGTDDGRTGGTAVVDLNAKVYGTDNLFVVDASIFPGMITTNPSAYIVTVAEHAAERILALR